MCQFQSVKIKFYIEKRPDIDDADVWTRPIGFAVKSRIQSFADPGPARPHIFQRSGALQIVSTAMLVLQISFSFSIDRNI